jgi:hypothetical protein
MVRRAAAASRGARIGARMSIHVFMRADDAQKGSRASLGEEARLIRPVDCRNMPKSKVPISPSNRHGAVVINELCARGGLLRLAFAFRRRSGGISAAFSGLAVLDHLTAAVAATSAAAAAVTSAAATAVATSTATAITAAFAATAAVLVSAAAALVATAVATAAAFAGRFARLFAALWFALLLTALGLLTALRLAALMLTAVVTTTAAMPAAGFGLGFQTHQNDGHSRQT